MESGNKRSAEGKKVKAPSQLQRTFVSKAKEALAHTVKKSKKWKGSVNLQLPTLEVYA